MCSSQISRPPERIDGPDGATHVSDPLLLLLDPVCSILLLSDLFLQFLLVQAVEIHGTHVVLFLVHFTQHGKFFFLVIVFFDSFLYFLNELISQFNLLLIVLNLLSLTSSQVFLHRIVRFMAFLVFHLNVQLVAFDYVFAVFDRASHLLQVLANDVLVQGGGFGFLAIEGSLDFLGVQAQLFQLFSLFFLFSLLFALEI